MWVRGGVFDQREGDCLPARPGGRGRVRALHELRHKTRVELGLARVGSPLHLASSLLFLSLPLSLSLCLPLCLHLPHSNYTQLKCCYRAFCSVQNDCNYLNRPRRRQGNQNFSKPGSALKLAQIRAEWEGGGERQRGGSRHADNWVNVIIGKENFHCKAMSSEWDA